jgi:hypothetical protein
MIKNIIVTVSENYLDKLQFVTDMLHKEGMTITNLYEFGVIIGNAEEEVIKKLTSNKAIISLTEDTQVYVPPPDTDIQ